MAILHCFEKDVFQRVALITKTSDLQLLLRGNAIKVLNVYTFLHYKFQAVVARDCIFTAKFRNRFDKLRLVASCFEHQKLSIRLALFFEIAIDSNLSIAKNQDFITTLFDIKQKMRRQYQVGLTTVSNLSNQFDHSQARRRVEPICWFIKKNQPGTMNNRLGQLCPLLHTQRVRFELAVSSFT